MIKKIFTANLQANKDFEKAIIAAAKDTIKNEFANLKRDITSETREIIIGELQRHKTYQALAKRSRLRHELGVTQEVAELLLSSLKKLMRERIRVDLRSGTGKTLFSVNLQILDIKDNELDFLPGSSYKTTNSEGRSSVVEYFKWITTRGTEVILTDFINTDEGFAAKSRTNSGMIMLKKAGGVFRVDLAHAATEQNNLIVTSALKALPVLEEMMRKYLKRMFT